MALLVYSEKCKFSNDILKFIKGNASLSEIVRLHEIGRKGIPSKKITRVPTLITNDGKMCVGADVKSWLEMILPKEIEMWSASGPSTSNLDGSETSDMFDLERYGVTLQPEITPEMQKRIDAKLADAMKESR